MALRFGFHKTLLKIGKWRFGIGYSTRGTAGLIMVCIYAVLNLMWYMILGCLWMMYGMIWLFFILPIKGLSKLIKNKTSTSNNNQEV